MSFEICSQNTPAVTNQKNIKLRRSKLEVYVDILKVLSQRPLRLTRIMQKVNLNYNVLIECIDFLLKQKLVEKRKLSESRVFFEINPEGIAVLKYFRQLEKAFSIGIDHKSIFS
jgi:predicted transcriptional regulator